MLWSYAAPMKMLALAILSASVGCQSNGLRTVGTGGDKTIGSGVAGDSGGGSSAGGNTGSDAGGGKEPGNDGDASAACQFDAACPDLSMGVLDPSCVPGSLVCQGATLLVCDSMGYWEVGQKCPILCKAGACVGECVPGSLTCRWAGEVVERCDDDASTLVEVETCGGSTPTCFEGKCMAACLSGGSDCTDQPLGCCRGAASCASTGGRRFCR